MGALLFIGAWVLLGLGVLFVAMSGGPRGARERLYGTSRGARRATAIGVTFVFVVMGVAIPGAVIAGNEDDEQAGAARVRLSAAQERGRELFGTVCQQCHVLAAANAVGQTGPDLDRLKPPKALVLDAILKGRVRGAGTMPAGLYTGQDAEDVADFVAAVAGRQ
ncbi:MAG TPA: cytochrome c [Solirubrobacteraceae bacterium]|nr:cytochrome c [Solirubrobacteraceae bacterium]